METMAIETKTMVEPGIIKTAMGKMGLKERAEELLDLLHEMQIKRDLKLSWEECQRGECGDVFEAMKEIKKELAERDRRHLQKPRNRNALGKRNEKIKTREIQIQYFLQNSKR